MVDDRNILFYLRGRDIYRNYLPTPCKGLAREGRLTYESSFRRLCKSERIRVLVDSGFGLQQGRACRLGAFFPVTEEAVEDLLDPNTKVPEPEPLELPEPDDLDEQPDGR